MTTRYWLYKNNRDGGPAGYWGDWAADVFGGADQHQWGGTYSTESPEVWKRLEEDVSSGDVVVAYQTDDREVVGFCVITRMETTGRGREIWLKAIERLDPAFRIHDHKHGTILEHSTAVNGPVMLRELDRAEAQALVELSGAPKRVLQGKSKLGGYQP